MYYQVVYRTEGHAEFDMRHVRGKDIAYMQSRPVTDTLTRAGAKLHVVRDLPQAISELSKGKYDIPFEEMQEMSRHIHKNGKQLLYFINELLQLSDIEGNGLQFHMTEADIILCMKEYVETVRPQLATGVNIQIVSPHKHLIATIDISQIRLVTMHLLTNAARNTQQGSITVNCESRDNGLYVSVKDTGKGINEVLKGNIFTLLNDRNTFLQDNNPGLGLSICKAVIDALHGKIGAESKSGEGSTFWYWIPCKTTAR